MKRMKRRSSCRLRTTTRVVPQDGDRCLQRLTPGQIGRFAQRLLEGATTKVSVAVVGLLAQYQPLTVASASLLVALSVVLVRKSAVVTSHPAPKTMVAVVALHVTPTIC